MRRRDRISAAATLDEPQPSRAIEVVDDASSVASRRQMFTRDEVLDLLREVEGAAHDRPDGPQVLEIVEHADREMAGQVMCARADLVDPLLDIRSVLSG